ncbi:hypothetical protein B0H11DRAFT_2248296 [Mycena galericulata]|nr:hypothetical protein B0H11DRAFT_2248296 [Mycena galericulata]
MPPTTTRTSTLDAVETWQSQLICLFIILGFVLFYTLCCHIYTVSVGWKSDAEALDRILAPPPPNRSTNARPPRR